jgi:D-alanine transaminase
MWTYLNGSFLPQEQAFISPFDRGFLFSDGVYEVIRYYPPRGFFQKEAHLRRLQYGLEQLRIPAFGGEKVDIAQIDRVIEELIVRNEQTGAQATAYIQVTRGSNIPRQHFFPPPTTVPTLFITTSPFKPHPEEIEKGVRVLLEDDIRWTRCDIKTIALIPNVLSRQHAVEAGACETIWSRDGLITEGTHTNFCAVKDGTLVTPPRSKVILSGVTRQVVLDLCKASGIPFREAQIAESDIPSHSECMIIGTTTEITPVVRINEWIIADGLPGVLTRMLQKELYRVIFGN